MYRFILFYFVLYICIYVAPWSCEARHLVPLYVHTCSGMTIKLNLNLNLIKCKCQESRPGVHLLIARGRHLPSSWTHQLHSTHLFTPTSLPAGLNLWTIYTSHPHPSVWLDYLYPHSLGYVFVVYCVVVVPITFGLCARDTSTTLPSGVSRF